MVARAIGLLTIPAILAGVAVPLEAAGQAVPFTTIAAGSNSGIQTPVLTVIRTAREWRDLWARHAAGAKVGPAPVVDFSRDMVIAVFAGKVEAGTGASILRIVREEGRLVVLYRIANLQPGPVLIEPGTVTPFQIVRLPRDTLPVVFILVKTPDIYQPGR